MKMRLGMNVLLCVVLSIAAVSNLASGTPLETKGTDVVSDCNDVSPVPSDCVARIGDYSITKDELKQRWVQESRPKRESGIQPSEVPAAEVVLRKMLAEKAMSMEGRKLGYLSDESVRTTVERYRRRALTQALLGDYVQKNVKVSDEEIAKLIESDPNLSREVAERRVLQTKARPMVEQYYKDLLAELKLTKVTENFPRAAEIHQRLLLKPKEPRSQGMTWITNKQITTELSDEEKDLPLATFTGGRVTLYDWFQTLGDMAPPGRPKDLGTPVGVDKLLDRTVAPIVLVAKAVAEGHDKNEQYLKGLRDIEDRILMGKLKSEKMKEAKDATEAEVKAYFKEHPEQFATSGSLKVEQIWCKDLEAARKARKELDDGAAFEAVEKAYSVEEKSRGAQSVYPTSEGIFWHVLDKVEPNEVVGPLKGFYGAGVAWRVVKVLEKKASEPKTWTEGFDSQVKSVLMTERRLGLIESLETELLRKYPYTIYAKNFEGMDPLEATPPKPEAM